MEKRLKYQDLYEHLKENILSGVYQPGEKIPSENELSAHFEISRQTVRKALELLQDDGYLYAVHGRGTFCAQGWGKRTPSGNIAVVTTYLSDYIFPRVIKGIDEVLTENGYSILLKNTGNSRTREQQILEELLKKNIDGLIIEPSKSQIFCKNKSLYDRLKEVGIPYVFIQGIYPQMEDCPHIMLNDCLGEYLLTKHLTDLGHLKILGVFKADDKQGQQRHKGYVQALQEAGIAYDPDLVVWFYTEDRKTHPYEKVKQLCMGKKPLPFDAIVCYNDQVAQRVLEAIEESGLSCPKDIAVTGYDDSYLAQNGRIPLTTATHPQEKLGALAAEMLLSLIRKNKEETVPTEILLEPELVIRKSTDNEKNF